MSSSPKEGCEDVDVAEGGIMGTVCFERPKGVKTLNLDKTNHTTNHFRGLVGYGVGYGGGYGFHLVSQVEHK